MCDCISYEYKCGMNESLKTNYQKLEEKVVAHKWHRRPVNHFYTFTKKKCIAVPIIGSNIFILPWIYETESSFGWGLSLTR